MNDTGWIFVKELFPNNYLIYNELYLMLKL